MWFIAPSDLSDSTTAQSLSTTASFTAPNSNTNNYEERAGPSNQPAQQENASSSSASSRNNIAAAGGGGGGGPGDSDSDDDDNNHNDSNNSPNNSANAASDGNINNRSRYTYFRTNDVYNGMRRFEAALNYDQSDFINVSDIGDLSEVCTSSIAV